MELAPVARLVCGALNEFQLPRAIAHIENDRFLAWNERFKSQTGYSDEDLYSASLTEFIDLGDPDSELSDSGLQASSNVQLVRFNLRKTHAAPSTTGYAAKRDDGFILLMLDVLNPASGAIEDARVFGQEEERNRIMKLFHDEVSPKLLAAIFEVARAKEDLEAKGLQDESESVSNASEKLNDAIEAVVDVLDPENPAASA
jgi:PAS domain-containing protein